MTALGTPPPRTGGRRAPLPASPAAQKLARPRWRDGRLLAGVILMLVCVVVGARLFATSGRATQMLTAAGNLPAGHVLTDADLSLTGQRLAGDQTAAYLAEADRSEVVGKALTRSIGKGELLPAAAVAPAPRAGTAEVSLSVKDGRHPGLSAGDRVDVYATVSSGSACTTVLMGSGLEVVDDVPADADGSAATVTLRVPPDQAGRLVHAGEAADIDLVREPAGASAGAAAQPDPLTSVGPVAGSCAAGH